MTHEQVLQNKVGELRGRIRLLLMQQWVCVAATYAALGGLFLVAATKLRWWTDAVDYLWALLLLGAVTGLIIGWTRRITPLVAAQIADERAGLKERLSTAVELSSAASRSEIAEVQIADAARHARDLRVSQVLPWRAPTQVRYLLAAVALLLAVIYVPELGLFRSAQDRADLEALKREGKEIQRVAKEIEKKVGKKAEDKNDEILRKIAQNMKQLGKDQSRGRISKKQALLKMNALQKQLKEAERENAASRSEKSLDKVAADLQALSSRQGSMGNNQSAKALQQMSENLKNRDFQGAKRQLEELARKMQSGQMTPAEAQETAETLMQMAQAMQGSNLDNASEQMKEAARQLSKAVEATKSLKQQMAQAKTDAERERLQQQMSQALAQGMAQAGLQTQKAGGT